MAQSSNSLHEEGLAPDVVDRHRAIVSLMEELEAVDWYDQRVQAASNAELKAILAHNRDEEKEHAAMVLEWLRRNDEGFDEKLKEYLFTSGSILEQEAIAEGKVPAAAAGGDAGAATEGSLGIGSLKVK